MRSFLKGRLHSVGMLILVVFISLGFFPCRVQASSTTKYSADISKYLGLNMDHFDLVASHVHLSALGVIDQFLTPDGAATYNDWTNVLKIRENSLVHESSGMRLKTLGEARDQHDISAMVAQGLVFHEMAHAEFEMFVKKQRNPVDFELYNALFKTAYVISKRIAPELSSSDLRVLMSEIFAYYHEEVFGTLLENVKNILIQNMFDFGRNSCVDSERFYTRLYNESPRNFLAYSYGLNLDIPLESEITNSFVFVKGKSVDYRPVAHEMQPVLKALWNHFDFYFHPPHSLRELLGHMNSQESVLSFISPCRKRFLESRKNEN